MLAPDALARLAEFLGGVCGAPGARIERVARIHGGASRETYSLDLVWAAGQRGLILRTDPEDSLIDTERALEFAAYRSVHGRGITVPEAIALVTDAALIGKPFFVMERIEGGTAASPFQANPYGEAAETIGAAFFSTLGRIAAIEPTATPLAALVEAPAPDQCWRRELDHWAGVIATDALEPNPIAEAAVRRLRANPPPPAQRLALVHGDYRTGNFLHDGKGGLLAVLDWEMAHIGDPLEDLAWALDPLWRHFDEGRAGGMLAPTRAIALWEEASGCRFDAAAFRWWALFASLKGLAIWLSSARAYAEGRNTDPVLSFTGWYCTRRHEASIAARLAAAPRGAVPEVAL